MIEQKRDRNNQIIYKEKLGKIIQYSMSTDKTAVTFKCRENTVKVQEILSVLEDNILTKAAHLLKSLSKSMHLFRRGKSKNDGSRVHNTIHILRTEEIQPIIRDLRHDLVVEEITLGLQRVQRHDVIKI